MNFKALFLWPLKSRKVQIALATLIGAWTAEAGFNLPDSLIATIVTVGIALILGIAHEDNGAKSAPVNVEVADLDLPEPPASS